MPRGVKGSGKTTTLKGADAKKVTTVKKAKTNAAPEKKPRKAYPSAQERVTLADARIERLTKINASRKALIEKTEAALDVRKAALVKSTTALEKAMARKDHLIAAKEPKPIQPKAKQKSKRAKSLAKARTKKEKTVKITTSKRTPEELKAFRVEQMARARAARKAKSGN